MSASEQVRVETVTLSDAGLAMILLDQEYRNKMSAILRTDRKIAELTQLRAQYVSELNQVKRGIDTLHNTNTYDVGGNVRSFHA